MIVSTPRLARRSGWPGPGAPEGAATPAGGRSRGRFRGRFAVVVAVTAVTLLVAAGCTTSASPDDAAAAPGQVLTADPAAGEPSARLALEGGATVIDVRTPEEYASGHVGGAALLDIQDPSFEAGVAALDDSVTYVVYCRSGNRSAAAASQMREAGLTVLDGGGLGDMTAAGWPVES